MEEVKLPKIINAGLWIASAALFTLTIITFIGVIFRYVIFRSIPWAMELSQLLLMWMVYFGTAAVSYNNDHIVADALGNFLGERGKKIRQLISNIVIFIIMTLAVVMMIPYTINLASRRAVSAAMSIPQWTIYVTFIVGLSIMDGTHFWNIVRDARALLRKEPQGETREEKGEG